VTGGTVNVRSICDMGGESGEKVKKGKKRKKDIISYEILIFIRKLLLSVSLHLWVLMYIWGITAFRYESRVVPQAPCHKQSNTKDL